MKISLSILFIVFSITAFSQYTNQQDYSAEIANHEISNLLTQTSFSDEVDGNWEKPQPLGFIGKDYQRFHIHFSTVEKDEEYPYIYHVIGKSMVHNNICDFTGILRITNANLYREEEFPTTTQGSVSGSYQFYEDSTQNHVGIFEGTFFCDFIFDDKGEVTYNNLWLAGDSYCNNLFKGIWTPYNSDESKVCNWGDYRIPESGDLDVGAGEFYPNEKYFDHGWHDYTPDWELSKEQQQWWR